MCLWLFLICRLAVEEWIKSGKKFSIMRDHMNHCHPINGGIWTIWIAKCIMIGFSSFEVASFHPLLFFFFLLQACGEAWKARFLTFPLWFQNGLRAMTSIWKTWNFCGPASILWRSTPCIKPIVIAVWGLKIPTHFHINVYLILSILGKCFWRIIHRDTLTLTDLSVLQNAPRHAERMWLGGGAERMNITICCEIYSCYRYFIMTHGVTMRSLRLFS